MVEIDTQVNPVICKSNLLYNQAPESFGQVYWMESNTEVNNSTWSKHSLYCHIRPLSLQWPLLVGGCYLIARIRTPKAVTIHWWGTAYDQVAGFPSGIEPIPESAGRGQSLLTRTVLLHCKYFRRNIHLCICTTETFSPFLKQNSTSHRVEKLK